MENYDLGIVHVDMDAFYASVEEKDNPKLVGLPVVVGGRSKHGIVTTANYEARKYGIHSAMPIFKARRLCPRAIYIRPRMKRYREVSEEIFEVLRDYTDIIEKVSVDEAYLDIRHKTSDPLAYIEKIREAVKTRIGLNMSIGLSYNKFLAKLGSDWNKPNGIKVITREMLPEILYDLDVNRVHGIGPKSANKLYNIGVYTIKELLYLEEEFLVELFGKLGHEIFARIRGVDKRKIDTNRRRKSIGVERTFSEEIASRERLEEVLYEFSGELEKELEEKGLHTRTISVKVKDKDFKVQTRSRTLEAHISTQDDIYSVAIELLGEIDLEKNLRLLGVSGSSLMSSKLEQLSIFDLE